MSEITHCHYCINRHCTREGCSVSTRKYQEMWSIHQNSTKCAKRGRRDIQGSFCYMEKVCSSTVLATHKAPLKPRKPRQVKNAQAQIQKRRRYTQDDLFNLVELTYDIQNYTHRMFLVPELGVVLGHRVMLQEYQAILCTKGQQPRLVSYDTTYNLGNFYVARTTSIQAYTV